MENHNVAVVVLLAVSLVWATFPQFEVVKAEDIIYIRADGKIEGTTKILRDGDTYTLTGDIYGGIKVERNSTVMDGAGFTLYGNGVEGWGVDLASLSPSLRVLNVTVKNFRILNFGAGIRTVNNNTIIGNYIAGCIAGIDIIGGSDKNIIKNNTLENNSNPISIAYSEGIHIITNNNIINGTTIIVWLSLQPNVYMNYWSDYNGTDSNGDGIGDTSYILYENNTDNYPLMEPVDISTIPEFSLWFLLIVGFFAVSLISVALRVRIKQGMKK